MPTIKTSLTIDKSKLAEARAVAGPRGLSALMTEALDHELRRRRQLAALDALLAANPPTTTQLESARQRIRAVVDWTDDELAEALPDSLAAKPTKRPR